MTHYWKSSPWLDLENFFRLPYLETPRVEWPAQFDSIQLTSKNCFFATYPNCLLPWYNDGFAEQKRRTTKPSRFLASSPDATYRCQ
ncbi:Uncharacterized protein TPS_06154 [Trichinella pseudospiralis]